MELLGTKVLTMTLLGGIAIIVGILPIFLRKFCNIGSGNSPKGQLFLSALSCFGGGVILTTCFTHMLPEVNYFLDLNIKNGHFPKTGEWWDKLYVFKDFMDKKCRVENSGIEKPRVENFGVEVNFSTLNSSTLNSSTPWTFFAPDFSTSYVGSKSQGWQILQSLGSKHFSTQSTSKSIQDRSIFYSIFPKQYDNTQCSRKPLFFLVPVLTNFWPPRIFFVKTQRIRNKPGNFTNFLLYNQIILHKRGGNQSSGSTKSLHWLISFAACSLISG